MVFSYFCIVREGARSVMNQDSQESGLKFREFTPEPETTKYPTKRGVLKSTDVDSSRGHHDNEKEAKNVRNFEFMSYNINCRNFKRDFYISRTRG